jgi:HemK-like putative methylase
VLKDIRDAHVDFVEIDETHHATIQRNLKENGIEKSRSNILGGDLFQNITKTYDVILSNPPYIDPALNRTSLSVKKHEPHRALYGGDAGLHFISTIIRKAPEFLSEAGVLYLEHEPEQKEPISLLAIQCALQSESFSDQFGIIRYTRLSCIA